MNKKLGLFLAGIAAVFLLAGSVSAASFESVYTDLVSSKCKKVDSGIESETEKCPGASGYTLLSLYSDQRMSITVVDPNGKEFPLNYWGGIVGGGFSSLGDKAEWRGLQENGKFVPKALIVRIYYTENDTKTSKLSVAKIGPGIACVTEVIKNGPTANEQARQAADHSADKPCLKLEK